MDRFGLRFHHLGLVVRRADDALRFLGGLGYAAGPEVFDPAQNVNLVLCRHAAMPAVEIIWPAESASPIDNLVARFPDGAVYHACFVATDLAATLDAMDAAGVRAICVAQPTPAVLFGGRPVSFYNVVGMGLIEVIEDAPAYAATPL